MPGPVDRHVASYAGEDSGFSLLEVMIATVLLATALTSLAELFAVSVRNNVVAKHGTFAAALAAQKIEQLRGDGRVTPSSSNTLRVTTDGYVDFLDPNGAVLGTVGTAIPDGTAYIRRWSVEPLPVGSAFVLQVLVTRRRSRGAADSGSVARAPEEARMVTIARHAP
jgi:prepilin-type N-terminal cleavage/methylation domain-containing protein